MLSLSSYELVDLPAVFQRLPRPKWGDQDRQEYLEWLMSIKHSRVIQLERACGVRHDEPRATRLRGIGARIYPFLDLLSPRNHNGHGHAWNGMGFLFGFDVALVIAEELVRGVPDASWTIFQSKDKLQLENQLTAVKTPRGLLVYEPLSQGLLSLNLIDRDVESVGSSALLKYYSYWADALQLEKYREG